MVKSSFRWYVRTSNGYRSCGVAHTSYLRWWCAQVSACVTSFPCTLHHLHTHIQAPQWRVCVVTSRTLAAGKGGRSGDRGSRRISLLRRSACKLLTLASCVDVHICMATFPALCTAISHTYIHTTLVVHLTVLLLEIREIEGLDGCRYCGVLSACYLCW